MIFPRLKLIILNKNLYVYKAFTCTVYEVINDILTSGDSSFFMPELSITKLDELYKNRYDYKDKYLLAIPANSYIPPEADVFYFGVIDTVDNEYKIKVRHWNILFDNKSVPIDESVKASIPSGAIGGIKLGSIQMQLGHLFLGPIIHGFGYNTFDNLKEVIDNNNDEIDAKYKIGYNQYLPTRLARQQIMPYAGDDEDENLLSQDINTIGSNSIKYSEGAWVPICGNIDSASRRDKTEFRIAIRNFPFGISGVSDPTNVKATSWFSDAKSLIHASVFEYIKKAILGYGIVVSLSIEHSYDILNNIDIETYGLKKQGDQDRNKIRYDICTPKDLPNNVGDIYSQMHRYQVVVNIGPYSNAEAMMSKNYFVNSVCIDKRNTKIYINENSHYVRDIDLDYENDQCNICFVYCSSYGSDDLYFLDRSPVPDIIVSKLANGQYYKTFTGEYAQLIRVHGGINYNDIYNKWPTDWRNHDPRVPHKSLLSGGDYRFSSIICSRSYSFNELENYGYHPFKGPGYNMPAWGNNWLDYSGSAEAAPPYTEVIDTYEKAMAMKGAMGAVEDGPSMMTMLCEPTKTSIVTAMTEEAALETYKCFSGLTLGDGRDNIRDILDMLFGGLEAAATNANRPLVYHPDEEVSKGDWGTGNTVFTATTAVRNAFKEFAYGLLICYSMIEGELKTIQGRLTPIVMTYPVAVTKTKEEYETFTNDFNFYIGHARGALDYVDFENEIDAWNEEHQDSELPSGQDYFDSACELIQYFNDQKQILDDAYNDAYRYAYDDGSGRGSAVDLANNCKIYKGGYIPSSDMDDNCKSSGEETYNETRYTDIGNLKDDSQVHKDMENRLRQLDYEFKEAINEINSGYNDDIECTINLYFGGPYNPYNLRPGMRGDIYYNGKEYKGLMLTAIKINTNQNYFTLVFGARRSTFYSTFKRV